MQKQNFQAFQNNCDGFCSCDKSVDSIEIESTKNIESSKNIESFENIESKIGEKCAVVGIFGADNAAALAYYALFSMQHRGQEASGIAISDGNQISLHKGRGLTTEVFSSKKLENLKGNIAIGHNRYSTAGAASIADAQPIFARYDLGQIAIAHNGNLTNANSVRDELISAGAIFQSDMDTENLIHLIAREKSEHLIDRIKAAAKKLKGAFCFVILSRSKLFVLRDSHGFRPLSLGKIKNEDGSFGYIVASETCAFDLVRAEFVRDIVPGELLVISRAKNNQEQLDSIKSDSIKSNAPQNENKKLDSIKKDSILALQEPHLHSEQIFTPNPHPCVFEFIYFARPDSKIFGKTAYLARKAMGRELAKIAPVNADMVIAVPDSGLVAALGYSQQSGIPFEFGIVRNHYVGRTFIEPSQSARERKVRLKLNPICELIEGKSIVVIDDSIVRGTTSRLIVQILRDAGAKEIHMRITAPQTIAPCFYGIDTPQKSELISARMNCEELCSFIGADSLAFLSLEALANSVRGADCGEFCQACFDEKYFD